MSILAIILLGFLSFPFAESGPPAERVILPDTVTVTMTAKKYEFSPSVITVKQGQQVKLEVTAIDRSHGLAIKDYNVDADLEKGKPVTVEFVADKPGEFTFKCSDYCGLGHGKMKGKLVVTPAA
jgi:cytochrome c oxidase subunit 2